MSTKPDATSQPTTTSTTPNTPGFLGRAVNSVTQIEHDFTMNHPIIATAVGVGLFTGGAAAAAPVVHKAVTTGKRWFGGMAKRSSQKVTDEIAGEGVKAFTGGAGRILKLFR